MPGQRRVLMEYAAEQCHLDVLRYLVNVLEDKQPDIDIVNGTLIVDGIAVREETPTDGSSNWFIDSVL